MDKAEEFINKEIDFTPERTNNAPYVITKLECKTFMEQYAQQVSREVAEKAFNYGYDAQISHRSFNEFWDNWIKNQQ